MPAVAWRRTPGLRRDAPNAPKTIFGDDRDAPKMSFFWGGGGTEDWLGMGGVSAVNRHVGGHGGLHSTTWLGRAATCESGLSRAADVIH